MVMKRPSPPAPDTAARHRRVRLAFSLASLAAMAWGLATVGAFPDAFLGIVLFAGPPLLAYVFAIRSLAGSVSCGLALLAVIGLTTLFFVQDHNSTAGLAFFILPFIGLPAVGLTYLLERAIRSPSGLAVACTAALAVTLGVMHFLTQRSAAESFCNHSNGLGNTMIVIDSDSLTASEVDRLVAFQPEFEEDSRALREEGFTEGAQVAEVWAAALAAIRDADSEAELTVAYDHLQQEVQRLYGSTDTCSNIH